MTDHIIHASLLPPPDGRIRVPANPSENPLEVEPGDTVEWRFVDENENAIPDAEIEFIGFLPEIRTAPILGRGTHPFDALSDNQRQKTGARFRVANPDRGLYLYTILRHGQHVDWELPLFSVGSFSPFFGGIIIVDPPRGG